MPELTNDDLDALRELLQALLTRLDSTTDGPRERWYQAVVAAVNVSPASVDLELEAGDDTGTVIPRVAYLASYSPTVGDTVWLLRRDEDRLVFGVVAT